MVTVTSLYICISYIYTYSYNFYYLSSLHSYCMSIFSVTCSMSLAYLLSIHLLYSCFYTLHIPYSFYNLLLFISYHYFSYYVNFYHIFHISLRSAELILYYHIIYCHRFSHILSCAFIYYTFHISFSFIYFMYFSCVHIYFIYFLYFSCLIISHILFISSCTLLLILVPVYYHRIAVLCFSYYVIYSLRFICIYLSFFFMFHVCKYLRSGYRK